MTSIEEVSQDNLLEVRGLKTQFLTRAGTIKAVDGVNLTVRPGEILGLVGESGSGKSVTSLSIMRLVSRPGRIVSGSIRLNGLDLLQLPEADMVKVRGNRISMVFQQPQSSLDPVYKVGAQVAEAISIHRSVSRDAAWKRAVELLDLVGIPDAGRRAQSYPHEFSGGMAQRVMIAIALACDPELLIADEPTTALDVTIQAQILDLLNRLRKEIGMAVILITHDLGVIAEVADRVAVMYAGRIVEHTEVETLFDHPLHPYTQGLIKCMPSMVNLKEQLAVIPGSVPNLIDLPPGCKFQPRCLACQEHEMTICHATDPSLVPVDPQHEVRCWLYQDDPDGRHKAVLVHESTGSQAYS
jgi:oligopeptide/dipeptide ABC transporter ATP-binding protein